MMIEEKKSSAPIILAIIGILVCVGILGINIYDSVRKTNIVKSQVMTVCNKYNVQDVSISVSPSKSGKWTKYNVTVHGTSPNISMYSLYKCVYEIDNLRLNVDGAFIWPTIYVNDKEYRLDYDNEKLLLNEDRYIIYEYESKDAIDFKEELKNSLPYEGMPEEYINKTKLGFADKELSHDYYSMQERARWVIYTWYDENGFRIAEAKVSYWDRKTKSRVDGYVDILWISDSIKE